MLCKAGAGAWASLLSGYRELQPSVKEKLRLQQACITAAHD
jgi:hypothetical protein